MQQYREDEVNGVLQVALTNSGPSPVVIERVELDWPGFAEPPAADPAYRLDPGLTADLPRVLGGRGLLGLRRPAGAGPDDPAVARVRGRRRRGDRVPLPASAALERIFTTDCRRQHTAAQVGLAFGPEWVRTGAGLRLGAHGQPGRYPPRRGRRGRRGLRRRQRAALRLPSPARPGPGGARCPTAQAAARLPVEVRSTLRCDGHSLGESKKTYVFDVVVDIGDGEDRPYALTPDAAARALMQTLIKDACGL